MGSRAEYLKQVIRELFFGIFCGMRPMRAIQRTQGDEAAAASFHVGLGDAVLI